ncbi:MAG: AMP-binding protein [Breznakibacter sp.]
MNAITDFFEQCAARYPNNPLLWEKRKDHFQSTTYAQAREHVYRFAAGLMALGIRKGDRLALLSEGCNNWLISELGMFYAGAVNVPLSVKLAEPADLKFRLEHSGARMVVTSPTQAGKLYPLLNELDAIDKMIVFDSPVATHPKQISFDDVLLLGDELLTNTPSMFEQRWRSVLPSDHANICYTSGTTADPKGIVLTHRNYTANVEQSLSLMTVPPYYVTLLLLPWDHAFAHTVGTYTIMRCGASIASVQVGKTPMDTLKNFQTNLQEIKPHFLLSVPALAKNFSKNIRASVKAKGPATWMLFMLALHTAYAYNGTGCDKGKGWRALLKPLNGLFDKIIFKKIREGFGGRLAFFVGGGALLDVDLQRFFFAIGIPMYQGYGLTEASPVISSNGPNRYKMGSSGVPAGHMELKICDSDGHELPTGEKGEIVIRGGNTMDGYWKNPAATSEALKNGWLYTGDLGAMDKDGFLHVFGRFKSLLIADDGEKYSPEGIEEALVEHAGLIEQCMLYNNQNAYTVALVVVRKDTLKRKTASSHKDDRARTALKLIGHDIQHFRQLNQRDSLFPQRWLPTAIAILPEGFTEENQLLNSTLKMVRGKICERYANLIAFLYTPGAKDFYHVHNVKTIKEILS